MATGTLNIVIDRIEEKLNISISDVTHSIVTPRYKIISYKNIANSKVNNKLAFSSKSANATNTSYTVESFEDGHHSTFLVITDVLVPTESPKGIIVYDDTTDEFYTSLVDNADFSSSDDWKVSTPDEFLNFIELLDKRANGDFDGNFSTGPNNSGDWVGEYIKQEDLILHHLLKCRDSFANFENDCYCYEDNLFNWQRISMKLEIAESQFSLTNYSNVQKLIDSIYNICNYNKCKPCN